MTESTKPNLRQKLIQVYSDIDHVEKAGTNSKQNYRFVRAADVLRAIRTSFAALGIYAETNYELLGTYDIKTNAGGVMHTATVKATIVLHDADSNETKTISGLGDGADSGDKGIYKAQTGATKNALRNGSLLPDEADPEADEAVDDRTDPTDRRSTRVMDPTDFPDFQEAQHGAPRPAPARPTPAPAPKAEAPSAAPSSSEAASTQPADSTAPAAPAAAPSTTSVAPAAAREPGDESDESMPTEEEMKAINAQFRKLGDDLSCKEGGGLKSSTALPINRKLAVFVCSVTGAASVKTVTKSQWENFFARVVALAGPEEKRVPEGLVGLAKLVNKANGIEDKPKAAKK